MLNHSELTMALVHNRHVELLAQADRSRVRARARRRRRRAERAEARGRPDGTLAACEPRVAAPAR